MRPIVVSAASAAGVWLASTALIPAAVAAPPAVFSPKWFAARGPGGSLAGSTLQRLATSPEDAALRTRQSLLDFSSAARAIASARALQNAAHAGAAAAPSSVADGLGPGGLQVAPGVGSDPTLWRNAGLPTESAGPGGVTVTVTQTAPKAIVTWRSFDIGRHTRLLFDQSGGTQATGAANPWIVLNRISDPSGVPSHILGAISAQGSVYLLNRNGIIFGGSSQVAVHTLIASSLDLFDSNRTVADARFLGSGINDQAAILNNASAAIVLTAPNDHRGAIVTEPGAGISGGDLGFVLLAAPTISHGGSIVSPDGQVALVGGFQVVANTPGGNSSNEIVFQNTGTISNVAGADVTRPGTLTVTGLIQSARGTITLLGGNVTVGGVIESTTSIARTGGILIDSGYDLAYMAPGFAPLLRGPVTISPGAVLAIMPDDNGQTSPSDATSIARFTPQQGNGPGVAPGLGTINVTGRSVDVGSNALLYAPGQTVTLNSSDGADAGEVGTGLAIRNGVNVLAGYGRVYVEPGAVLDVAGLPDITLPMSYNLVTFQALGNELADSPLQRQTFLRGSYLTVDARLSGVRSDGLAWSGTPLADAGAYLDLRQRGISQDLINGGEVQIGGEEVDLAPGATINIAGGYEHFLGGMVRTSRLVTAQGFVVDIGSADPLLPYVGFAGTVTSAHPHWNVTRTYVDPLIAGSAHYQADDIQGGNGGALLIGPHRQVAYFNSTGAVPVMRGGGGFVDDATVQAGAVSGPYQVQSGSVAVAGTLAITNDLSVTIARDASVLPQGFSATSPLLAQLAPHQTVASDPYLTGVTLSADQLTSAGYAVVTISTAATLDIRPGTVLAVQDGGSIALQAYSGTVAGRLVARSGTISLTTSGALPGPDVPPVLPRPSHGNLDILPGATLDASGRFVDASGGSTQAPAPIDINGGSVTLEAIGNYTSRALSPNPQSGNVEVIDTSGSIAIDAGALIDVSSGAYVQPNGMLRMKNGLPIGTAGAVTIETYAGTSEAVALGVTNGGGAAQHRNSLYPNSGLLFLSGTINGEGFSGGGRLTLGGMRFAVGATTATTPTTLALGELRIDPATYEAAGFSAITIDAAYDASVLPGTTITLTHTNLVPAQVFYGPVSGDVRPATDPDIARVATLPIGVRSPGSLTLGGGLQHDWVLNPGNSPTFANYAIAGDTLLVGSGATIRAEPGGAIALVSPGHLTMLGTLEAPGGTITLDGSLPDAVYGLRVGPLWVGPHAVIDAAGTAVAGPPAAPVVTASGRIAPATSTLYAGGQVSLLGGGTGLVVAPGAVIDVSGATSIVDVVRDTPSREGQPLALYSVQPTEAWSDAGTVTLKPQLGLAFDGTLLGRGGAPRAAGATLRLSAPNGVLLIQSGDLVPGDFATRQRLAPASAAASVFAVDRLTGSGFANLVLGNVDYVGPVSIDLPGTINITGLVTALPDEPLALAETNNQRFVGAEHGSTLALQATYVQIAGTLSVTPSAGVGTLDVHAALIDLAGAVVLSQIGSATLASSGDLRLLGQPLPNAFAYNGTLNAAGGSGTLQTTGNVVLQAAQIYPATGTSFAVISSSPRGTITVLGAGGALPAAPLSAGGAIALDATTIIQGGVLRAPFGSIVLGSATSGNGAVATRSVTLRAGSLTSVSGADVFATYGNTIDDTAWYYDPNIADPTTEAQELNGSAIKLGAPPAKQIALYAQRITTDPNSVLDLSGGGELLAQEFVAGTGGSRDILSRIVTTRVGTATIAVPLYPDGRDVYAILPGYAAPIAPVDPAIDGEDILVGQRITLSGGGGLPAGVYTLLPGHDAVLPGAYRVVQQTGTVDPLATATLTLRDGTSLQIGALGNGLVGTASSHTGLFSVQSRAVWQREAQYDITAADAFFPVQSAQQKTFVPRLPEDAGHLILSASEAFDLAGTDVLSAPDGRGGEVDIASRDLEVFGAGTVDPGFVGITVAALDALGAESLLLGGVRVDTLMGTTIEPVADRLIVANDARTPLVAPEILLTATPLVVQRAITLDQNGDIATLPVPVRGTGTITLRPGSVILATGRIAAGEATLDVIGAGTTTPLPPLPGAVTLAQIQSGAIAGELATYYAAFSGSLGSLVRVSQAQGVTLSLAEGGTLRPPPLTITDDGLHVALPALAGGAVQVLPGASLIAGGALQLASSGDVNVATGVVLAARNISIDASHIAFVQTTQPGVSPGVVIDPASLFAPGEDQQVTLRSAGSIDFRGAVTLDIGSGGTLALSGGAFVSDGGAVDINAGGLTFENLLAAPEPATVSDRGQPLRLTVGVLDFGSGDEILSGFSAIDATASRFVAVDGTGTLSFGAVPVAITTPAVVARLGGTETLTTTGALSILPLPGNPPAFVASEAGGAVALQGASILVATPIEAIGGNIALIASASDVTLAAGGALVTHGFVENFFDIAQPGSAGAVRLSAEHGQVVLAPGSTVDISAAAAGADAGSLSVIVGRGFSADGTLLGGRAGAAGSLFSLEAGAPVALDPLASVLAAAGIDGAISVRSAAGDLVLDARLVAQAVTLVADGGIVRVAGTIDASGTAGGQIALYGTGGVSLAGALLATGSSAVARGGSVVLGTSGQPDGTLNQDGSEHLSGSGTISLAAGSVIDVSGGSFAGLSGGIVTLRAPIIAGGVNVATAGNISGAREIVLEAYKTWNTQKGSGFDGIIDPAGLFDAHGQPLHGFDPNGVPIAGATNAAHLAFYNTTLLDFVENPGLDPGRLPSLSGLVVQPGIELVNGDTGVNGGNINVVSDWDFGQGSYDPKTGARNLFWRDAGAPGVLTLRAANTVFVKAGISDGFFLFNRLYNPDPGSVANVAPITEYQAELADYAVALANYNADPAYYQQVLGLPPPTPPTPPVLGPHGEATADPNSLMQEGQMPSGWGQSWSYRLTGGADLASADPVAVQPATAFAPGQHDAGSVILTGHRLYVYHAEIDVAQSEPLYGSYLPNGATNYDNAYVGQGTIVEPAILRTGTGSIDIAAALDIDFTGPANPDALVQAAVYTAGLPVAPAAGGNRTSFALSLPQWALAVYGSAQGSGQSLLLTPQTLSQGAGDVTLRAGRDVNGNERTFDDAALGNGGIGLSNDPNAFIGQFWTSWLLKGRESSVGWSVNFGSFAQGVMSLGGNISIDAGGIVRDVSASLPTEASVTVSARGTAESDTLYDGGTVDIRSGGDVLSGGYYVGAGSGSLHVGGALASDVALVFASGTSFDLPTLFALQDATITVHARKGISIGAAIDPTYTGQRLTDSSGHNSEYDLSPDFVSMAASSRLDAIANSGDVTLNSALDLVSPLSWASLADNGGVAIPTDLLPAEVNLFALGGGLTVDNGGALYPSAAGSLQLIANGDVTLAVAGSSQQLLFPEDTLQLLDFSPSSGIFQTVLTPQLQALQTLENLAQVDPLVLHDPSLIAARDARPVRIESRAGNIEDGTITIRNGFPTALTGQLAIEPSKPAVIEAGETIDGLVFYGQNLRGTDITQIIAGGDITFSQYLDGFNTPPAIELSGPGQLLVQAGGNITFPSQRLFTSATGAAITPETGIRTLGNAVDNSVTILAAPFGNPHLPVGGASVDVLFGVAQGANDAAFVARYIDPAGSAPADQRAVFAGVLATYLNEEGVDTRPLSPTRAYTLFRTLSAADQQILIDRTLLALLAVDGSGYNDPTSPDYKRYAPGYQAINTLFPASLGYTANALAGGVAGARNLVTTGTLDMRGSTIQTQQGGDIGILGPGGEILVGSQAAAAAVDPASEGIITLERGNIDIFIDQSILVAQSRIFTEQGGGLLIWSSNGDIDAGRGAKTSVSFPPPVYVCDINFTCRVDAKGEVTGAGIATLQSLPNVPPGDVTLVAPRGTVDAGDAGIRVSGNLSIAAAVVANAENIEVKGKASGIPMVAVPNVSAELAGSTAAAAAETAATNQSTQRRQLSQTIITVEVLSFGG